MDGLVGIEMADVAARKMIQRVPAELTDEQKKVASRSHGLGIRPDQKEVWECDVEHHEVHVYDITGDKPKQIATIPIGSQVYWLTFSPDGKTLLRRRPAATARWPWSIPRRKKIVGPHPGRQGAEAAARRDAAGEVTRPQRHRGHREDSKRSNGEHHASMLDRDVRHRSACGRSVLRLFCLLVRSACRSVAEPR